MESVLHTAFALSLGRAMLPQACYAGLQHIRRVHTQTLHRSAPATWTVASTSTPVASSAQTSNRQTGTSNNDKSLLNIFDSILQEHSRAAQTADSQIDDRRQVRTILRRCRTCLDSSQAADLRTYSRCRVTYQARAAGLHWVPYLLRHKHILGSLLRE